MIRNEKIKQAVIGALTNADTLDFPLNIKTIVKSYKNIRLTTYSNYMKRYHLDYKEMIEFAGTKDAFCDYHAEKDRYIICYNDLDSIIISSNRYRWNIAHELGHVLLRHHQDNDESCLFRNKLTDAKYKKLDAEADTFAAYILVPHAPLSHFNINDFSDIAHYCKISNLAAKKRFVYYDTWLKESFFKSRYDFILDDLFFDTLAENYLFEEGFDIKETVKKAKCSTCEFMLYTEKSLYRTHCPICGQKSLRMTSEEFIMRYPGLEMTLDLRPVKCPVCGNEQIESKSKFCMICGNIILNSCSWEYCDSLDKPLPGNARYCPQCGRITTFYELDYIDAWNKKDELDNDEVFTTIDEDCPF